MLVQPPWLRQGELRTTTKQVAGAIFESAPKVRPLDRRRSLGQARIGRVLLSRI